MIFITLHDYATDAPTYYVNVEQIGAVKEWGDYREVHLSAGGILHGVKETLAEIVSMVEQEREGGGDG